MRLLRSHGMTTLTWDRHRGHAAGYDVVALGFNYRIDEPRAALATARLARLDARERRAAASSTRRYRERLAAHARRPPTAAPAHHLFTVVLDEGVDRDAFRAALHERGVQTSLHYPPVHRFSIYADGAPRAPADRRLRRARDHAPAVRAHDRRPAGPRGRRASRGAGGRRRPSARSAPRSWSAAPSRASRSAFDASPISGSTSAGRTSASSMTT